MFRVGKVVAVDEKTAKVRVEIEDLDNVVSYWLPVITPKTQDDKFYYLPDIGELVLVGFLDYGIEQGFVLGSIYNEKDTPPVADKNKFQIRFKDGTVIEYDRKAHKLFIDIKGDLEISVNNSNITSITTHNGDLTINGNLLVNGNITASQNIADLGGAKGSLAELRNTYNSHTHDGDSGGTTSTPNQTV